MKLSYGHVTLVVLFGLCIYSYYNSFSSFDAYQNAQSTSLYNIFQRSLRDYEVKHKDLFPLNQRDIWGTILVGLGTMIAASGMSIDAMDDLII